MSAMVKAKQSAILFAAVVLAFCAWGKTETVDGYTWTYRITGNTAEIYNNGYAAISPNPTGVVSIPETLGGKIVASIGTYAFHDCAELTSVTIPDGVTNIGAYAFNGCHGFTSVVIPGNVTAIADDAFCYCGGLTNVIMKEGVMCIGASAFSGCSSLASIRIPDSVTSIGYGAFLGCSESLFDMTTIPGVELVDGWAVGYNGSLPDELNLIGIRGIGEYTFWDCRGLTSVTIPNVEMRIADYAFIGCDGLTNVIIGIGITHVGHRAFSGCSGLTNLTIPNSVTRIESKAFFECNGLNSVTIPDSVTDIGDCAFYGCSGLTSVTIPDSVTNIASGAFAWCDGLMSVTIPACVTRLEETFPSTYESITNVVMSDSVTGIGDRAFFGCSGLTSVAIPDSVTNIASEAFAWCDSLTVMTIPNSIMSIGDDAFYGCSGLTNMTIPDSVKNIGDYAFCACGSLTNVVIGNGVTNIGNRAFSDCNGLTHMTIGNGVTSIGWNAFDNCSGLESITIPNSVTNIGISAFYFCSGLTSVTIPSSVMSIGASAFGGCSSLASVYLPLSFGGSTSVFPRNSTIIRYKPVQTVVLNVADGEVAPEYVTVDYGSTYGALPVPSRIGSSFVGWMLNGNWITDETVVQELDDHTLVAQWQVKKYTVTFDANGGSGGTSMEQDCGTAIVAPIVSRAGHTFIGWLPDVDATVPESNVTYAAQWRVNQYTVTFDANGGTGGTNEEQDYGTPIIAPTVARGGYTFIGWSPEVDVTVPASNVMYRARWQSDMKILYAHPFRQNVDYTTESGFLGCALSASVITNTDAQPLLYETFGMQVRVDPSGMTDIDLASIEVHMAWFTGETPWGWENWINNANVKDVVLDRASDWSAGNLVYRSNPNVSDSFIPPQIPKAEGYQVVQYHIWVKFKDGNGVWQAVRHLGDSDGDWTRPYWYNPVDKNKDYGTFSAYTLLDVFAPKRVWLNEVNMYQHGNLDDVTHQYVEIAAPQGCDLNGWSLEAITQDNEYIPRRLFTMGQDGVASCKGWPATNRYVFYAIQSPRTMAAGTYGPLDGVWRSDAFRYGTEDISRPCALRLVRPSGIVEHEVVFMCTNTYASYSPRFAYLDGTNFLKEVKENVTSGDASQWLYAGADDQGYAGGDYSLGVYTGYGEENTWTNAMIQTPGEANRLADGTQQSIDPDYFNPPPPSLEIYAYINWDNRDVMSLVVDGITNTSTVIVVPYNYYDGTFATRSIDFLVEDGYEIDTVTTNGVNVVEASGKKGCWTLNINLFNPYSYNFVVASARLENYGVVAEKATCERTDGGYSLTAKDGETLVEGDIALTAVLDGTVVDTTKGYDVVIAADGKGATARMKTPTFGAAALVADDDPPETDSSDPTGTLVESDGVTLSTQPWPNDDEEIGALPVAAVPGLYYQAAWGDSLDNLTTGAKVQATTDTLYLGVIKQTGTSGFYKVTVSER